MLVYALGISLTLFLAWWYVWERLIETASLDQPLRQMILGFFVIAYALQAARWVLYRVKGDLSWVIGPAYFSFGLLSHLFMATLLKDVIFLGWWWVSPATFDAQEMWLNSWVSWFVFFICLAANLWGAQTAYEGPEVREVTVDGRTDPSSTQEIRLVQISDVHIGPLIKEKYVDHVVLKVNSLKPDVVAVTGDLGDARPEHVEEDLEPFKRLEPKWGTFYVTGNHEYYWSVDGWLHAAKSLGMKVLFNHGELLPKSGARPVWIAGVPDISAHRLRKDHVHDVAAAAKGAPAEAFKILLAHQPRSCFDAEKNGFDLMLSGHTHGGQYFPFTMMVHWFNPFSQGLGRLKKLWVYVNVGTGFWGPPLRLGVTSEITLMRILL